jgi:hypothetical protein
MNVHYYGSRPHSSHKDSTLLGSLLKTPRPWARLRTSLSAPGLLSTGHPNPLLWAQGPGTHTSAITFSSPSQTHECTIVHSTRGENPKINLDFAPSPSLSFNNLLRHQEYSGYLLTLSRFAPQPGTHMYQQLLVLQSPRTLPSDSEHTEPPFTEAPMRPRKPPSQLRPRIQSRSPTPGTSYKNPSSLKSWKRSFRTTKGSSTTWRQTPPLSP